MIDALGTAGEKIIGNDLTKAGHLVEHSIDKYDKEKDMLASGKKVEVKTQVPFINKAAFTIRPKQLNKCRSVDLLFFVSVPAPKHPFKWSGWIFEADPKNFEYHEYTTKDDRLMVIIPIEQEHLKPVRQLTADEVKELIKYTVSDW